MAASYKAHGEWEKAEFCYCRALAFAHRFTVRRCALNPKSKL